MPKQPPSTTRVFPPVMRRGLYWWLGLTVLFSLGAVAWVIFRKPLGVPRGWAYRYGALVLGLTPPLVLLPLWLLLTRSVRRALLESEGRLCTHCAYDVSRLPESGRCPECGHAYDTELDKPMWESVGARYEESDGSDGAGAHPSGDARPPPL